MLTSERQRAIIEFLEKEYAVTTTKLMKMFDVSFETIRKDLIFLEKNNELMRVHGGAVSKNRVKPFYSFEKRTGEYKNEKKELSLLAAKLIDEEDVIGIDAGTTAIEFTEAIMQNFTSLTIVTYSMDVFERVKNYKNFKTILCGGSYMKSERVFYGTFTCEMLSDLHVMKAFIFPTAISLKGGVSDYQPEILALQQKLIENSSAVVILADSSKYEKNAMYKVCNLKKKHIYVTDSLLPQSIKKVYEQNGYTVITREEDINEGIINFM